ncbi:mycothione reductase, partial [Mycobacterium sp. ITM-2017-0098]
GTRVTIVLRGTTMLSHCDDTVCERFTDIAGKKWEIRSRRNIVKGSSDESGVTLHLDDGSTLQADTLLVATGRVPNGDQLDAQRAGIEVEDGLVKVDEFQRTTARNVFALGDVS